ncbi:MAG: tetratricopeptide repeat protein [Planctomycetota bacterium]
MRPPAALRSLTVILAGLLAAAGSLRADLTALYLEGAYDRIIAAVPADAGEAALRLRVLAETGDHARLIADGTAALAAHPGDPAIREAVAAARLAAGDLAGAVECIAAWGADVLPVQLEYLGAAGKTAELRAVATTALETLRRTPPVTAADAVRAARVWQALDRFQEAMNAIQACTPRNDLERVLLLDESGALFAAKHNAGAAADEFTAALKLAPRHVPALTGLAAARFEQGDLDAALDAARRALAVDSRRPDAAALTAFVPLLEGDHAAVIRAAEAVQAVAPRHAGALAMRAAALRLARRNGEYDAVVRGVDADGYGRRAFRLTAADLFIAVKQGDLALELLQPLLGDDADDAAVLARLGWIMLRKGQTTEARALFERAHTRDGYDAAVFNVLTLLDRVAGYARLETAHVVIIYDPAVDEVTARYFAGRVEEIYTDLAAQFGRGIGERIQIYFFPDHASLAVMTTGVPRLDMPALCVGTAIYCDTPDLMRNPLAMNWSATIRHEMVHVFNLVHSNFNVPHWFTEGLAVLAERQPQRLDWDAVLLRAELLGLRHAFGTMNTGFFRPADRLGRFQAYAEAHAVMRFIVTRYGFDAVNRLIAAFAAERSFDEAVAEVLQTTPAALQAACDAEITAFVQAMGIVPTLLPDDLPTLERLAAAGNVEAAGWLMARTGAPAIVERYTRTGKIADPVRLGAAIAREEGEGGDPAASLALLEQAAGIDTYTFHRLKGVCHTRLGDAAAARREFLAAWKCYAGDPSTARALAEQALAAGAPDEYTQWQDRSLTLDDGNIAGYLELALFHREKGDLTAALGVLDRARAANPADAAVLVLRADAFLAMGRTADAIDSYRLAALVKPYDLAINTDLIRLLAATGQAEEAAAVRTRLGEKHTPAAIDKYLAAPSPAP